MENPICPECDLPDYACTCEQRITTVHGRYHVAHPKEGLIEAVSRRADAFLGLRRWYDSPRNDWPDKDSVTVYDSMARVGQPHLWGLRGGRIVVLEYRHDKD